MVICIFSFATNILGGALGSIPYQSAANTTLFVAGQTVAGTYLLCEQPTGSLIAPILCNLATLMASPGPIGSTTRSTVQATTVNATSTNVGSNIMAVRGRNFLGHSRIYFRNDPIADHDPNG